MHPLRIIGFCAIVWLATLVAMAVSTAVEVERGVSEAVDPMFEGMTDVAARIARRDPADLVVPPGARGYDGALETVGPQLHYHAPDVGKTLVVGDVYIGDELHRLSLAGYDGPPAVSEELRHWAPRSLLVVESEDGFRSLRARQERPTRAGRKSTRDKRQSPWTTLDLVLRCGSWTVEIDDLGENEVVLDPWEKVVCRAAPAGLEVVKRIPRRQP